MFISRCSAAISGSAALFGVGQLPGDAARSQLVSFMVTLRNTRKRTPFSQKWRVIGRRSRLGDVLPSEFNYSPIIPERFGATLS